MTVKEDNEKQLNLKTDLVKQMKVGEKRKGRQVAKGEEREERQAARKEARQKEK